LQFVFVQTFDPATNTVGTKATPHVQVVCGTCGHAEFFAAKMAGLVP
jgi:hypothetical protein